MKSGYIRVWQPNHPLASKDGYVLEHRKVAFDAGLWFEGCFIHHKNHDKTDNRLENLEAKLPGEHGHDHAFERGWSRNQFGVFPVKPKKIIPPERQKTTEHREKIAAGLRRYWEARKHGANC